MLIQKPKEQIQILIVDDQKDQSFVTEIYCRELFTKIATKEKLNLDINEFEAPDDAMDFCLNSRVHIILLDKDLGERNGKKITGMDFIKTFHELQPWAQIIILTADNSYTEIAKAIRLGASDYLLKGREDDYAAYRDAVLSEALNRARLELLEFNERAKKTDIYSDFACKSSVMRFFDQKLKAVAESSWPVLFLGESGLGKGSAARRVNEYRRILYKNPDRPFVNVNIGALSDELAQSELFGHEPNAFTGASNKIKPGLLDAAAGGDIFLDEIGDASLEMQLKLLKVVEERTFTRVGGRKEIPTDARFIFATNKNLSELVEKKLFRADLYMRISAFELQIPKLSERKEDLPEIIRHMIKKALKDMPNKIIYYEQFPEDLIDYLTRDHIKGNIRGIENDVIRLITYAQPDSTGQLHLKDWKSILGVEPRIIKKKHPVVINEHLDLSTFREIETNLLSESAIGLKELRDLFEKKLVEEAMKKNQHNLRLAALNLKIATSHLHTKMKQFKIPTKREVTHGKLRTKNPNQ
jgi:DNA-binding NtrC family response regulator